ncbi:MAG: hypothetical protein KAS53_05185 [Candidatus Cloacimonetes bacterium]|nr:hypothetical protein [Candidatus Cloacimonadota bacterium]
MKINQDLLKSLSHENIELSWSLESYLKDDYKYKDVLREFIDSISEQILEKYNNTISNNFIAKKRVAAILLNNAIQEERIKYLRSTTNTPTPYKNLSDSIDYDENYLIDTDKVSYFRGIIKDSDFVYHVIPSIQQKNSMYWAFLALDNIAEYSSISVRLDPFMFKHKDDHRIMIAKMDIYGVPLDWNKINNLKETLHSKWMSDNYESSSYMFTEVVWERRSDGIHFICEETPNINNVHLRGSRYFHAIYNPDREVFTHTDGAIRIYDSVELKYRNTVHVRKSGKIGKRIKIFKVNGDIKREDWCILVSAFFVWNNDIYKYFNEL